MGEGQKRLNLRQGSRSRLDAKVIAKTYQEHRVISQRWVVISMDKVGLVVGCISVEERLRRGKPFRQPSQDNAGANATTVSEQGWAQALPFLGGLWACGSRGQSVVRRGTMKLADQLRDIDFPVLREPLN